MAIVKSFSFPDGDIRGDMFYIRHDSDNFTVIDCFLKTDDNNKERINEIISEIKTQSKDRIHRFISTHPDNDHIKGIEYLDKNWRIVNFYAVDNNKPNPDKDEDLNYYHYLRKSDKYFKIFRGLRVSWLNQATEGHGSSNIHFLWPNITNEKFQAALKKVSKGQSPNNISPVIYYEVRGYRFLWMGDLETDMQQEFYDQYKNVIPEVHVVFAPHHGRESGSIPKDLMEKLNPDIIVIGNAPCEHINYCDPSKTITQNTAGDIIFDIDDAGISIYTQNDYDKIPDQLEFRYRKITSHQDFYYLGTLK